MPIPPHIYTKNVPASLSDADVFVFLIMMLVRIVTATVVVEGLGLKLEFFSLSTMMGVFCGVDNEEMSKVVTVAEEDSLWGVDLVVVEEEEEEDFYLLSSSELVSPTE